VLLTGYLMTALALARGEIGSWYYIPWLVVAAAVAFRGLARTHASVQIAVALCIFVLAPLSTHDALADWGRTEQSASQALDVAKGVAVAGCPLYLANFDIEQRVAIPLLFPYGHARPVPACGRDSNQAYALSWERQPLPLAFGARCTSGWQSLASDEGFAVYRCQALRRGPTPDQNAASGYPEVKVVRVRVADRAPVPHSLFQPVDATP
jgi:hypothetical protein